MKPFDRSNADEAIPNLSEVRFALKPPNPCDDPISSSKLAQKGQ